MLGWLPVPQPPPVVIGRGLAVPPVALFELELDRAPAGRDFRDRSALDDAQGLCALRLVGDHAADLSRAVVNGDVNAITPKLPALTQVVGDGVGEFLIGGWLLTGRQRRPGLHAQPRRLLPQQGG